MVASESNGSNFVWTTYYTEFASKLLLFKDNRSDLLLLLKDVYDSLGIKYPFLDEGQPFDDICPFTIIGRFNKGITDENRMAIMNVLGDKLGVKSNVPNQFEGIPVLNNMQTWFFGYRKKRKSDDISNLWDVFEAAIAFADHPSDITKSAFRSCYDKVLNQFGIKWNITMGLYWIRPYFYLSLDERNRNYLCNYYQYASDVFAISNLKDLPDTDTYLNLISLCTTNFDKKDSIVRSFPELSYEAWKKTTLSSPTKEMVISKPNSTDPDESIIEGRLKNEVHYWIYAPGDGSRKWEEFYSTGVMGIGWDEMGDLKRYPSKENMKVEMKKLYGEEYSYKNAVHATWQFANELKIGDIVYVKRGLFKIIGRGVVESEYSYDYSRNDYRHIHKVKWTHIGEWEHPGQAVMKTLTDITSYTDYVQKLESLFLKEDVGTEAPKQLEVVYDDYTAAHFLDEVFMDADQYNGLVNLIKVKKNIILQGAPGVGKTFAAKRLAYSIMGQCDTSRIMMIQFHQSYSYEDFIMGYRPTNTGFELTTGPFYQFCKLAEEDDERDYFFIIDEMNRGNLSKIFGELLMLIESDKRGEQLRLLYSDELFSVPKNVHIIGMMNTADRSLAMIDYALRRRFAFVQLEPAFESEGFQTVMAEAANPKFYALVEQIKALNHFIAKDESLGDGFRIGHSYFCTKDLVTDEWLNAVVEFELLPLLKEYWFDEQSNIEQWTRKLRGALDD
jgi:5-methylcytosine-specific restriction protein B